jgi:hypothetical protein
MPDEASGVAIPSNIVVTFSEAIARGVGNVLLDGEEIVVFADAGYQGSVKRPEATDRHSSNLTANHFSTSDGIWAPWGGEPRPAEWSSLDSVHHV